MYMTLVKKYLITTKMTNHLLKNIKQAIGSARNMIFIKIHEEFKMIMKQL